MHKPWLLRLQMFLASHPKAGNRVLSFMGARRIDAAGQRAALAAARRAYDRVPFYRRLFEQHGFTKAHIRRLTWSAFQQLPLSSKELTEQTDQGLLDGRMALPGDDALIGRSSGTLHAPVYWPLGWKEFYLSRASFEAILRNLGTAAGARTAAVLMTAVEGGDQSGNMPYRAFYSLKEETGWEIEVVATGENSQTAHDWLRWFASAGFTSLFIISFPGTMERLLDYMAALPEAEQVRWDAFQHKHVVMGGQVVARHIRDRVRAELHLPPISLTSETVLYISSDTGQLMARSTPFTIWLERHLAAHPELYTDLGLAEEYRDRPLVEFVPPLGIYFEFDHPEGLLLTMWKHRPLVRYKIGDLVWTRSVGPLLQFLNQATPGWREAFARDGGQRVDIPTTATIGVVLGRADEIVIVNAANISPAIVQQALTSAGLGQHINHFKHRADPDDPNAYYLYLEHQQTLTETEAFRLSSEWQEPLLAALVHVPAATDLLAAHSANAIVLHLTLCSRGTGVFEGDSQMRKKTHAVPRHLLPSASAAGESRTRLVKRDQQ